MTTESTRARAKREVRELLGWEMSLFVSERERTIRLQEENKQQQATITRLQSELEEAKERTTPMDIICPFCQEEGFDLVGLKYHL